ncbi:hypothetical protein [Dyella sedimenti]|uniref:hypothetical protein n=1 Tax=Dyella sedimenti TaxID=2919947 RepID=UPI001FAAFEF3|nr:hypothetical protein [Dyella sedimenti]
MERIFASHSLAIKENTANKRIKVLASNPGVGKTQQFIEGITADKRYVYAAPTRVLALEVMKRLDEVGHAYKPIFTGQTNDVKSVIHQASEAMAALEDHVLIITHKCLASVKPELLRGWELCIDEAPDMVDINTVTMPASEYDLVIAPFVGDCDVNGHLLINDVRMAEAWEIHAQGMEDAKNNRTRNKTLLLVLDAMLTPTKNARAVTGKDSKGKNVVRVSVEGFTDFTRAFNYANSVTLMGANVEKSLVATHAMKRGFTLDIEKEHQPRAGLPFILPLVRDAEGAYVSKRMLLTMPDGSVANEWNSECFGQKALERALAYIGDKKAIFASFDWCRPDLPENVERIPYDSRGLNKWRDVNVSIHIIHGNLSPDEYGPIMRIFEQMGVPHEEGKEAHRWAREEDLVVQHAHRTSLRDKDNSVDTIHIVTSLTQARRLRDALGGNRVLDLELMVDPPETKPTEGQKKRETERSDLAMQVKALKAKGMGQVMIAKFLGISQPKVSRLLKDG